MTRHVVQFSTGAASAEVAYRIASTYGVDGMILLTANTLVEDDDNWRFARDVVDDLGLPEHRWIVLTDGRTPMQVGRDRSCVPSNRMPVCSEELKRKLLRHWINDNCDPASTMIYLGYDWTEIDRHAKALPHWAPFTVRSPLLEPPYVDKPELLATFREVRGIQPPRLYGQGFPHANCGGACVRGGKAQWELLLRVNRPRYLEWEAEEEKSRAEIGKNVSILRDTTGAYNTTKNRTKPLTLQAFRQRLNAQPGLFDYEKDDWGACGCT